jgi:4-amino-4-deoxy-L-arabinose transferase-like glycosyltransferase
MHAEIARELLHEGGPLPLTFNGVPYVDKPPLFYLALALAFRLGGPHEAVARAVPALAALAALGAVAWLGARLRGPAAGALAATALLASPGFFAYGRYLRPETLFVAAIGWGLALTLVGLAEERPRLVAAGFVAFGLAGLAKDPLGTLAPPFAVALGLAPAGRLRPVRRWLPWTGAVSAVVLGLGWWALAERLTPGFTWYTVVDNHLFNVLRVREFPDEDVPLGAAPFLVVALAGGAPTVVSAAATGWRILARRAWRVPAELPWVVLTLWGMGVLLLVVLSPFRLPHYGLPAYPALALLAARGWLEDWRRGLVRAHALVLGAAALALAALWLAGGEAGLRGLLAVADVATRKAEVGALADAPAPWPALRPLLGVAALVTALGALAGALCAGRPWSPGVVVAASLALLPCVAGALGAVSRHRSVAPLARHLAEGARAADLVVHEGPLENSGALQWYGAPRPVIVDGQRSVLAFAARRTPGETFWSAERVRAAWQSERRVWLLTVRPVDRSLAGQLPGAALVAQGGGRRLYVNRRAAEARPRRERTQSEHGSVENLGG